MLGLSPWLDPSQWTVANAKEIREWLIALGTIGAVGVALYATVWREWRRRPKLSLSFDPGLGATDQTEMTARSPLIGMTNAAYVRFRAANERGRQSAEDVEVLVLYVQEETPGQAWQWIPGVENWPLIWSNSLPTTTKATLPAGVKRHFDLLHVYENAAAEGRLNIELDVHPAPPDRRHQLPPGHWKIRLAVTARNADATMWETKVMWDGRWGGNVWDHLSTSPPKRMRRA